MTMFELWQDGLMVASTAAKDAERAWVEINHYAQQYAQDGPVKVYKVVKGKRVEVTGALFSLPLSVIVPKR